MKARVAVLGGCLLALMAAAAGSDDRLTNHEDTPERLEADRRQERLLFAYSTTTSVKRLATVTLTALSTCLSTFSTAAGSKIPICSGRKRRTIFSKIELNDMLVDNLSGTLADEDSYNAKGRAMEPAVGREVLDRKGRKFTIWSTYVSTLTLTSTSYLTGTTVTITAMCVAAGVTQGCFGK
ncbi:uncharacterized protein [Procambarus clarkii]|uniref:uncharacterized protein n=1 Tax=Procambarus clarkii TaxID=6728 RepID=UPI001E670D68|nr:uncharacterized protein LOC123773856 [Procambarus clarkii]